MRECHTLEELNYVVVDDETMVLDVMVDFFSRILGPVMGFSSPEKALEYAQEHAVDVLITDMKMPGMRGDVLIEKMKAHHRDLFSVIISGTVSEELDLVCQPDLFFNKPLMFEDTKRLRESLAAHYNITL